MHLLAGIPPRRPQPVPGRCLFYAPTDTVVGVGISRSGVHAAFGIPYVGGKPVRQQVPRRVVTEARVENPIVRVVNAETQRGRAALGYTNPRQVRVAVVVKVLAATRQYPRQPWAATHKLSEFEAK